MVGGGDLAIWVPIKWLEQLEQLEEEEGEGYLPLPECSCCYNSWAR
jgi:hypothetical protein